MFTNWLTSTTTTTTNAPPPDVILEVGPPPYSRYAAHGSLLSAHSGYLRSAVRPDERNFDTPIYLPNITSEQFAPLLTYMYTGFLDLSIDNIFGVLLATHVLHMPRALEICRAFLSRIQSEGYLGGNILPSLLTNNNNINNNNSNSEKSSSEVKIIRPIASKASGAGIGFVAPPVSSILLPSRDTPFKILHHERERSPIASTSTKSPVNNSTKVDLNIQKKSPRGRKKSSHSEDKLKLKPATVETPEDLTKSDEKSNKIIIDIASCDGPVRFLRVLNDSYGRTTTGAATTEHRNPQNVVTSFHLQMAKNIIERSQQRQHNVSEESENSQEIIIEDNSNSKSSPIQQQSQHHQLSGTGPGSSSGTTKSEEVYSCVYCKHTFKSQYCYQKHAKRHLNPLRIDSETIDSGSERDEKGCSNSDGQSMRREVRPLDMNVQYYPCKTCGSKFPSYYFVHKHRKLCHANEEN